jgi:enoyl-CoA hydratase/carnithine racemase
LETIRRRDEDHITIVELDRPDAYNAMSNQMLAELAETFRDVEAGADIRALVLAGSDKVFCTGADLKERGGELAETRPAEVWRTIARQTECLDLLAHLPQPTICAISGYALGGGLEIALCCDLRVASPTAKLGLTEARVGTMPGGGGTQRLPRLIGVGPAAEMLFTASHVDAPRALELGLVNVVADDWLGAAIDLAGRIAANSPIAVQLIKDCMLRGMDGSLEAGLRLEAAAVGVMLSTDDMREGVTAFNEKRPPRWSGV